MEANVPAARAWVAVDQFNQLGREWQQRNQIDNALRATDARGTTASFKLPTA